jgi:hypothetical protein
MKARIEVKSLSKADEIRKFEKGHLEVVKVGGFQGFADHAKAK